MTSTEMPLSAAAAGFRRMGTPSIQRKNTAAFGRS